ncbi:Crp/Fnr family transcriptional regulator [Mariniflexile aquimaris]|uniref:Crp/Fnr family transcriptional regulator n=1 Tax=Mariniflexile aquimaris TaxID=881009 RepID=A0ABW3BTL8_9FLAO
MKSKWGNMMNLDNPNYLKLKQSSLFNNIPDNAISNLLEIGNVEKWPKKTYHFGDKNLHKFHIILRGKIKVYNYNIETDRYFTLYILRANDMFDVLTLMNGLTHNLYYESLNYAEVLSIPIDKMTYWLNRNPIFVKSLLAFTLDKMNHLENYVKEIIIDDTPTRFAKLLLKYHNKLTNKLEVINNLPHDELANLIGTTRAVLNRHIRTLKLSGVIKIERKNIEICDIDQLIKIIKSWI